MRTFSKTILQSVFNRHWKRECKRHVLKWVEIEVTRRCPLDCLHCGSSCSPDSKTDELSMDEILNAMRKIATRYNPKDIKVAITGGEPLIREDIYRLMAHITEMGFRASVVTNGLPINETNLKLLAASGIKSLSVSLDGMEANHDWLRNRKGAFRSAVKAIRMLVESGLFYVEPLTTVNRKNLNDLEEMEALMLDLKVPSWRLGKIFPIGRAREFPDLFLKPAEYRKLMDFIKARYTDKKSALKVSYCEEGYLGNDYELEVREYFAQCPAGINILTILSDGNLIGCAANHPGFIQGNLRRDDIIDVWENRFSVYRDRSWMKQGICGTCSVYENCRGDGMHLWQPDKANPYHCNYSNLIAKK